MLLRYLILLPHIDHISLIKSVFLPLGRSTLINTSRSEKPDQPFIFHIFVVYICPLIVPVAKPTFWIYLVKLASESAQKSKVQCVLVTIIWKIEYLITKITSTCRIGQNRALLIFCFLHFSSSF